MTSIGNNALALYQTQAIEQVKLLSNIVLELRTTVFQPKVDYGVIPGTNDKPTLLLPGMEKLMRALRLRPEYTLLTVKEDFDKPLFYFRYECRLVEFDTSVCVSTAIGSANSFESKWHYRKAARICPECGKETIIKGKEEYGGGWLCFAKKGGCGAKFKNDDKRIIEQPEGRVVNEDIFDQINTIDKIAQKRALGSAIKGAANVSEFFTVDLEDISQYHMDVIEAEVIPDQPTNIQPLQQPKPANVLTIPTPEPEPEPENKLPDWVTVKNVDYVMESLRKNGMGNADITRLIMGTHIHDLDAWGKWESGKDAAAAVLVSWENEQKKTPPAQPNGANIQAMTTEEQAKFLYKEISPEQFDAALAQVKTTAPTSLDTHSTPQDIINAVKMQMSMDKPASKPAPKVPQSSEVTGYLTKAFISHDGSDSANKRPLVKFTFTAPDGTIYDAGAWNKQAFEERGYFMNGELHNVGETYECRIEATIRQDGKYWRVDVDSIPSLPIEESTPPENAETLDF